MAPPRTREPQRIAKLLARAGIASRREIERMIAEGRIALSGTVIDTPATLLASLHGVTVDGKPVGQPAPARLFVFHKPTGYLTTERDPKGRKTIYDRLPKDLPRLVPVGRLDMNTEGLLLMTTDGELKRQLELPSTGVERSYRARAYGTVSQAQLEELIHGIEIEGVRYGQIDANLERRTGANSWIEMTLTEGKNREVRRVLEHLGLEVSRLIRTRYGPFVLGDLPVGEIGEVRQHDLIAFRKTLALPAAKRVYEPVMAQIKAPPPPEPAQEAPEGRPRRPARAKPGAARPATPSPRRGEGRAASAAPKTRPTRNKRDEAPKRGAKPGPNPKDEATETRKRPPRTPRADAPRKKLTPRTPAIRDDEESGELFTRKPRAPRPEGTAAPARRKPGQRSRRPNDPRPRGGPRK